MIEQRGRPPSSHPGPLRQRISNRRRRAALSINLADAASRPRLRADGAGSRRSRQGVRARV